MHHADGHQVHVDDEGFLTEYEGARTWPTLAAQIGIELTDAHWKVHPVPARGLQDRGRDRDHPPRLHAGRRSGKELFTLFPQKPAKKMAYIAGLPKPHGCV